MRVYAPSRSLSSQLVDGRISTVEEAAKEAQATATEAQKAADDAKATADESAASVNEYMDALLGLDATNETGAADAE